MAKYVGTSVKRVEDPRFIQGKGSYVANIELPNMAYMAVLRSPHAHAKVNSINTDKAKALEGVIDVYTGQDTGVGMAEGGIGPMPSGWNLPDQKVTGHHALTIDKVRYVGDGVAAIVAESPSIAEDALALIEVDYEVLPLVVNPKDAHEAAIFCHDDIEDNQCFYWALGDKEATDKAFEEADHIVELKLVNQRLIATAIEPRADVAQWNPATEEMTVWLSSQNPHIHRILLAAFTLGVPENKLRVISPDVGGGFGSKIPLYAEDILVPWAARKINRPVKWVATRTESSMTDRQGRDHVTDCKMALKSDGTMTGIHVSTWANLGAYVSTLGSVIPTALYIPVMGGLYKIPGLFGEVYGTLTNTAPVDAYRGAGRPEMQYLIERLVDIASRELDIDPIELRRKNFIPEEDFPYQTPVAVVYDSGNYAGLFDKLVELSDYDKMRKDQEQARKKGKLVGVGVSGSVEFCGLAPSAVVGSLGAVLGGWEMASVRIHPTGSVTIQTGSQTTGQGHETAFAQIAADELGIDIANITVEHGDTGNITQGLGTYGSRSGPVGGGAISMAAEKIRIKAKKIAAHLLEAAEEDMVYDQDEGKLYVKGSPDKSLMIGEVAFSAYVAHNMPEGVEPGLEDIAYFDPSNFTFPNAAHIAQVEIDADTGAVTLQRYIGVDDVGTVINPMIVEGQLQGGIVQGIGQALWEHGVYDENGQLLSGSLMDYALPRADMFPNFELGNTVTKTDANPLGVKGVGEMGTIVSTPTVVNAVMDALAPLGIKHIDMPLTPEKIWQAIQASKNGEA